ncbi:MAG TPA: hypothetical protein VGG64_17395 [Pirellulales bacterium]|jgi:hypothetical protein
MESQIYQGKLASVSDSDAELRLRALANVAIVDSVTGFDKQVLGPFSLVVAHAVARGYNGACEKETVLTDDGVAIIRAYYRSEAQYRVGMRAEGVKGGYVGIGRPLDADTACRIADLLGPEGEFAILGPGHEQNPVREQRRKARAAR